MSSPPPHTAAEKAEARRLKILAKKRARMAYALGDRTQLPSASAPEPVRVAPLRTARDAARPPTSPGPVPSATRALRGMYMPAWLRGASVAVCGASYAASVRGGLLGAWRVSAVEMFACVELCLALPRAVAGVAGGGDGGAGGGVGAGLGWVDTAVRVGRYATAARGIWGEFAVFMVCFLCAWYVGERA